LPPKREEGEEKVERESTNKMVKERVVNGCPNISQER
jgi:hypothetical protein